MSSSFLVTFNCGSCNLLCLLLIIVLALHDNFCQRFEWNAVKIKKTTAEISSKLELGHIDIKDDEDGYSLSAVIIH